MNTARKRITAHHGRGEAADRSAQLRPAPARPWQPKAMSAEMQHQFLDALLLSGTLDEACRRTGITRGVALAARARDAMFALAWDRVNDTRLAELESLLLEKAVRGLDPESDASGSAQEKFVASLGQWFLEARAGHRYGRLKGAAAQKVVAEQPAAEAEAGDAATEVKKLISQTAARLEAMEKNKN